MIGHGFMEILSFILKSLSAFFLIAFVCIFGAAFVSGFIYVNRDKYNSLVNNVSSNKKGFRLIYFVVKAVFKYRHDYLMVIFFLLFIIFGILQSLLVS